MHLSKLGSILGYSRHDAIQHQFDLEMKFQGHINAEGLNFGTREEYFFRLKLYKQKEDEIEYWNSIQDSF